MKKNRPSKIELFPKSNCKGFSSQVLFITQGKLNCTCRLFALVLLKMNSIYTGQPNSYAIESAGDTLQELAFVRH